MPNLIGFLTAYPSRVRVQADRISFVHREDTPFPFFHRTRDTTTCGQVNPNNSSECRINPDPDGDGKANITFRNNVKGGPSTDQFVTVATANMVESAVKASGVDSVNISSTTGRVGAKADPGSNHPPGKAVDINEVNGKPVDQNKTNPASATDVAKVQDAFAKESNIRENFGPARNEKTPAPGAKPVPENPATPRGQAIINAHKDHIHVSGQS